MSTHLRQVAALLAKGTTEESLAAAVVLGALAPKDKIAVDALGKALNSDNLPLALTAARALGRIGNTAALKALLPLLEAQGELRETGALAIAGCGKQALPAVKKALAAADFDARKVLYAILADMRTPEAWRLVMGAFFDDNFELVKVAGRALRGATPGLGEKERAAMARFVTTFLNEKATQESRSAVNSGIILLGYLGRADAAPALLPYTTPDRPRATRRHALTGIKNVLQGAGAGAAATAKLFPYLDDTDYENVVEPTLQILGRTDLPGSLEKELMRLVGARHVEVRQFAVRKLAEGSTKASAETLVGLLASPDERLRQSATHAVRRSPKAPALLLPRLLAEKDPEAVWALVHLVKPQAPGFAPADRRKVAAAALKHFDKGDKRAEPLLHLYRHLDEDDYFKTFRTRAAKAKTAKKYRDAERDLRMISRSPRFDAEARFDLALVLLKAAGTGGAASRDMDDALVILRRLCTDPGFDLAKRLGKEARFLGPDGAYTLGFHFVEGTGAVRELGAALLDDLARKSPRTKPGKMARSKLTIEGIR